MPIEISLTEDQKRQLTIHSTKHAPNESCALLYGIIQNEKVLVKEVFLAQNQSESPVNFTISNEELLEGYRLAEEKKLDVVGIFHSHPSSDAWPSSTDEKFMFTNPVVWIIYSGRTGDFKAFVLESQLKEITILIRKSR